jgi:predicted amidohydrolase
MRVAVIQLKTGKDKAKNIKKALCLVKRATLRGAKFIVLPEAFNARCEASSRQGVSAIAEDVPGPSLRPLMEIAKKNGVAILAGSLCERVPRSDKAYNTSVFIDRQGRIAGKYRKVHLFDATIGKTKMKESRHFLSGKKPVMITSGSWKVGLSICFDVRFPEFFLAYRRKKADILCVPSAFTKTTGKAHWEILLRSRAIENRCYVLAPNQAGKDARGVASYGNSMIIDPWGEIMARASGNREEVIWADVKKRVLAEKRAILGA